MPVERAGKSAGRSRRPPADGGGKRPRSVKVRNEDEDGALELNLEDGGNSAPVLPTVALGALTREEPNDPRGENFLDLAENLELKPNYENRPVWIVPDGRIFLETFSPVYKPAYDFLVAIAEPVSRPELVHEYKLTPYALYAAVSVGIDAESIISVLSRLSKTKLPPEIPAMIRKCTATCGKAKLVLHRSKCYVQTSDASVLRIMRNDPTIQKALVSPGAAPQHVGHSGLGGLVVAGQEREVSDAATVRAINKAIADDDESEEEEEETGRKDNTPIFSFEVIQTEVEHVKKRCLELDYPLIEEYDFRNDTVNASIDIDLRPIAKVRPYQEKALSKMFGNGRARSGVIVLPCGAGKSLVGVTAACTLKKTCLCLCTSSVSVEQWRYQFYTWSNQSKDEIGRFVSGGSNTNFDANIIVTTYSMIAHSGKRSQETQKMLDLLRGREWGLLLLDEVHVVPANVFRRVLGNVKAHTKLGLTATLLREDDKIDDINFLIGPKLYEANWLDLQKAGFLATVQCAEVWCPMTAEFYREYLTQSPKKKKLLYSMNPNKFRMTEYLVKYHEERQDKIIIFSDNVFALKMYADKLRKPFIYGATSQHERMQVLQQFKQNPACSTVLLSKVGDTSIDIPEANVLIQISSHYGSRRQEAQRLGRILRPKPRAGQNFNAFFYSMVSSDTTEMFYSSKRQQFLVDQGYAFKVITHLNGMDDDSTLQLSSREEQLSLLEKVLAADENESGEMLEDADERALGGGLSLTALARRSKGSIGALSGAGGLTYNERATRPITVDEIMGRKPVRHTLFKNKRKKAKGIQMEPEPEKS